MKTVSWDLMRSFLAVVQTKSLSGAARALGTTQPTIGRHIETLEDQLGVSLFVRSQMGLVPTDAALDLVPHAQTMATASDALVRSASGEEKSETGVVRITASDVIGSEVLPEILTTFHEQYRGIELELHLSNKTENLSRREADIAVRMVRPKQQALVARKIGIIPIFFYAHKRYVQQYGLPESVSELEHHTLIGPDSYDEMLQQMQEYLGENVALHPKIRTDNHLAQTRLLQAGIGIGGMQKQLAIQDEEHLLPVLPDLLNFDMEMWLCMPEDLRTSHRIRLVFDHLTKALKDYVQSTICDQVS